MKTLASLLVIGALTFTGCARQDTAGSTDDSSAASSGATEKSGTADSSSTATAQPSAAGTGSASTSASNASATTPAGENWNELKGYSYDQRGEFNSSLNAMSARVEAEISELRAQASGADASASRRAAMEEVQSAKSDFDEKSAALARASQDTWEQARNEASAAWDRLQAAIARARSEGDNKDN